MNTFVRTIRKEKGCLDFSVYRDSEMSNSYILVGEWKSHKAQKKHFESREFELLIGAARVLGERFSMNIAEVYKTGGNDYTLMFENGLMSQERLEERCLTRKQSSWR